MLGLNPKAAFKDGNRPDIEEDEILLANKAKEQERLEKQAANRAKKDTFQPRKVSTVDTLNA